MTSSVAFPDCHCGRLADVHGFTTGACRDCSDAGCPYERCPAPRQATTARHPLPGPLVLWGERRQAAWLDAAALLSDGKRHTRNKLADVMSDQIVLVTSDKLLQEAYRHGVIERWRTQYFTATEYGRWHHEELRG